MKLWALSLAMMLQDVPTGSTETEPEASLAAEHLYNGVQRPARITVQSPRSFGSITLVLMDADGKPLAERVDVNPGVIDLGEVLPAIWDLRRTAYLQMLDGERSVGTALVLQPMLSRMVPVTQVAPHPVSGKPHTRITGWVDENALPPPELPQSAIVQPVAPAPPPSPAPNSAYRPGDRPDAKSSHPQPPSDGSSASNTARAHERTANTTTDADQAHPAASPTTSAAPAIERVFTGLRMYPERDVILHTTRGDIRLAMKPEEAPNTAWNFLELCRGGFYRDVEFHRIVPLTAKGEPFVIQAGDPSATGDGGPGYWLPMEDSRLRHDFGVISMARSDDPDSNGSQFFICLSREGTARLDGQYCSFGYAVDGAQTIIDIARSPLADVAAGRAVDPPMIVWAELAPSPPREVNRGRPDHRVSLEQIEREPPQPSGRIPR